jgi:hypothetical protein
MNAIAISSIMDSDGKRESPLVKKGEGKRASLA